DVVNADGSFFPDGRTSRGRQRQEVLQGELGGVIAKPVYAGRRAHFRRFAPALERRFKSVIHTRAVSGTSLTSRSTSSRSGAHPVYIRVDGDTSIWVVLQRSPVAPAHLFRPPQAAGAASGQRQGDRRGRALCARGRGEARPWGGGGAHRAAAGYAAF